MAALQSPHAKSSERVVEGSMKVIVNLTVFDAGNRAKLGDMGACPGAVWVIGDLLDGVLVASSSCASIVYCVIYLFLFCSLWWLKLLRSFHSP